MKNFHGSAKSVNNHAHSLYATSVVDAKAAIDADQNNLLVRNYMARAPKINVQCPTCVSKCINHKTFQSTRVVDYSTGRAIRYFRCGPINKDRPHTEHEWPVEDVKPGDEMRYIELGDENPLDPQTRFGHKPIINRWKKKVHNEKD